MALDDCFISMSGLGTCIFCKRSLAEVGRAVEHVIPGWLQREWNLSSKKISPLHLAVDGDILSSREHNFAALLAGRVCQSCNGGWMSELEVSCRPLILPLASGHRRVVGLTNDEALLLARWAVKTAYALHSASNWRRVVDENHYQLLDKTEYKLPEGVFVAGPYISVLSKCLLASIDYWHLSNLGGQFTAVDHKTLITSGYRNFDSNWRDISVGCFTIPYLMHDYVWLLDATYPFTLDGPILSCGLNPKRSALLHVNMLALVHLPMFTVSWRSQSKKAATLEKLQRAEKEMTHLGARVQELRRLVKSANAPSRKVLTGADIKELCRQTNLTLDVFTRLLGTSRRAVATWLAGNPPNRANERNLTELSRLFAALVELVPTAQIGPWLETSNSAFEGSTPVQVIERGEADRIWRMIWGLRGGNSGD